MSRKSNQFKRRPAFRPYRKLFIIATEGNTTEPQYFAIFNSMQSLIRVSCIKGDRKSSPLYVLKRMEAKLRNEELKHSDEAWLVVDKDSWTDNQLSELFKWSKESDNYGLALSNPKFEYWLILHFENGNNIKSSQDCSHRLKDKLPNYSKQIYAQVFSDDRIRDAVKRAKRRDDPPCSDWPRTIGSTVYRLVEKILETAKS